MLLVVLRAKSKLAPGKKLSRMRSTYIRDAFVAATYGPTGQSARQEILKTTLVEPLGIRTATLSPRKVAEYFMISEGDAKRKIGYLSIWVPFLDSFGLVVPFPKRLGVVSCESMR
jgi:hypothetical protein